ncbi:MAG TPA: N-6 DNA methylase [Rhizomicrobium sp.]|nr:N-6 DNA methylase [Rhizomicrobium sp.]
MAELESLRKARGAFFTPPEICAYIAEWAIRNGDDLVLEPSCGEAAFLLEAAARLRKRGSDDLFLQGQLHGVEIYKASADAARAALSGSGYEVTIRVGDFFDEVPKAQFNAVIGNPPYVRYQQHTGGARAKSLEAALAEGVRLNGLASSWAAFVVHAARFLKPDGRLGLVLPAELLSVNYAAPVRRFLLQRFGRVRLVMFENLVFPGVLEEVVLLLAEGHGGAKCFEVYQARDVAALAAINATSWKEHRPEDGAKWTPALLNPSIFELYQRLCNDGFEKLSAWGQTYLGAVTGNNDYFSLSREQATKLRLKATELERISPPGSRHLRGHHFTDAAWEAMAESGAQCLLFYPRRAPSAAAQQYIAKGQKEGVHKAYKCMVRTPWWRVPLVDVPDLFLTYMNHDRPRLIANEARAHILNSLYGVNLHHGRKQLGKELLPIASLNSLTLLGAEMVGRAYGGGLLKLEPREADFLPMASKETLEQCSDELRAISPQLAPALRQGDVPRAVEMVDNVVLKGALKITDADIKTLRDAREIFFERRKSRGKGDRGESR